MMSVLGDWGGEDYQDLMASVEEVAERPYVDAQQLGLHDYSYGGVHGQLDCWTRQQVQGGGGGSAMHRPVQHVWYV